MEVSVADLDRLPAATSLLSADERERAERFHFERDRHRFIACRALLRELLGAATGTSPASIVFRYGPHGKPEIDGVQFNVSHSSNIAAIAVTRDGPLGIDLEAIDRSKDVLALAGVAFAPAECAALRALPAEEHIDEFFRTWTRKEAYLKFLGTGFSVASDSFTLDSVRGHCLLRDLDAFPGFACAIATLPDAPEPGLHLANAAGGSTATTR